MKTTLVFVAGVLAGAIVLQSVFAQNDDFLPRPNRALNHIGIVVADYDAAYAFYTDVLGLKEAYTVERDGQPLLTYLQPSSSSFRPVPVKRPG